MKDQLILLRKLQDIDTRTNEVRQCMETLPAKLLPAKKDLRKLETILQMENDQISEADGWRLAQEDLVAGETEALKHAKQKLQDAKTAREFEAASREVDHKKRSIREREQEVLKVYEALENTREKFGSHQDDIAKLRGHIEEEEAKFSDQLRDLEQQATEIAAGRTDIATKIDPSLLRRYENVIKRRGIAVVPVKDGVCQGCHMALAPQLNNLLARFDSIESCRQCNRLLYRAELLGDQADAEESAP